MVQQNANILSQNIGPICLFFFLSFPFFFSPLLPLLLRTIHRYSASPPKARSPQPPLLPQLVHTSTRRPPPHSASPAARPQRRPQLSHAPSRRRMMSFAAEGVATGRACRGGCGGRRRFAMEGVEAGGELAMESIKASPRHGACYCLCKWMRAPPPRSPPAVCASPPHQIQSVRPCRRRRGAHRR